MTTHPHAALTKLHQRKLKNVTSIQLYKKTICVCEIICMFVLLSMNGSTIIREGKAYIPLGWTVPEIGIDKQIN